MSSNSEASQLIAAIDQALTPSVVSNLTAASAAWDLFKAYLMLLILEAARNQGATVTFSAIQSPPSGSLYFRSSPGALYSHEHNYCYAIVEFPNLEPLEVHIGVYVIGKSTIIHECDIAVIRQGEAELCRSHRSHPRYTGLVASVECKFYSTGLGVNLGRSFLGLVADIKSEDRFFVTNISSKRVEKMLTHHKKQWEHEVVPRNPLDVNRFRTLFEDLFKRFKSR